MQIQIELIVGFLLLATIFTWAVWFRISRWIIKWRYKAENDKSKGGEENRRREVGGREQAVGRREPTSSTTTGSVSGLTQLESGELLQTTSSDKSGEDSQGVGRTKRRNPFRRKR